jgi:hypothetical protein
MGGQSPQNKDRKKIEYNWIKKNMIAYRNSLFGLLVNGIEMCVIQCQVIVVGVIVKTLIIGKVGNIRKWVMIGK